MGQICLVASVRVVCQRRLGVVINLGGRQYDVLNGPITLMFPYIHFGFDSGAVSLSIGGDKKAVRHECGTADGGVKVEAGDFCVKGSASESDHRGLLGLGWCVVGGVMPACVRKAEQSGGSIGTLRDMPSKGFYRVV